MATGRSKQARAHIYDPSERASAVMDEVLKDNSLARDIESTLDEKDSAAMPLKEALASERLVSTETSERSQTRILFITNETDLVHEGSPGRGAFALLNDVFDEVHVMVLTEKWQSRPFVKRIAERVWIYSTSTQYWWQFPFSAAKLAGEQLRFAEGFRPDVIVALDPFEAGATGLHLARKFDRPFQVQVREDMWVPDWLQKHKRNRLRRRIARYVLKRTTSLAAGTETIRQRLKQHFPRLPEPFLLPRFYNFKALLGSRSGNQAQRLFPQYSFLILFVGTLNHDSTLFRVLDAARSMLRSPRIALIVVGDGPLREHFRKRAEILGIERQVIFKPATKDLIPYFASADVLMVTDTTPESDETLIKAAAAGLPLILARTQFRAELFEDGTDAFLCEATDTIGFFQKLNQFINTNALRSQFAQNARLIVKDRLHENIDSYNLAYRDVIESALWSGSGESS